VTHESVRDIIKEATKPRPSVDSRLSELSGCYESAPTLDLARRSLRIEVQQLLLSPPPPPPPPPPTPPTIISPIAPAVIDAGG